MNIVEKNKQLMITVGNQVGKLAELTGLISQEGINLVAVCAYAIDNRGFICFVTDNNKKSKKILEAQGYDVREEEVVLVTMDNKPGALCGICERISNLGIDLTLIYGSVEKKAKKSQIVFVAEDNDAIAAVISMK